MTPYHNFHLDPVEFMIRIADHYEKRNQDKLAELEIDLAKVRDDRDMLRSEVSRYRDELGSGVLLSPTEIETALLPLVRVIDAQTNVHNMTQCWATKEEVDLARKIVHAIRMKIRQV